MTPEQYDAWYDTPRGRWIGETEYRLLRRLLDPAPEWSILDVGCGTGWFTRRVAADGNRVLGLDTDRAALDFARSQGPGRTTYVQADATHLPFADRAFDAAISVTALCFVADWTAALAELVRVVDRRFAVGLLHRRSVLHLRKGRDGGAGAYRGAHWHRRREVESALRRLPVRSLTFGYAVFAPSGNVAARLLERVLPSSVPLGAFLAVAGSVAH